MLGVLRWAVDSAAWSPSPAEFAAVLARLPPHEVSAVTRFQRHEDRKRAAVSRLLQRAAVVLVCGVREGQVRIARTRGNKPYTTNAKPAAATNFNFNVSHEGSFTALAADPLCVVGVDVAAPRQLARADGVPFSDAVNLVRGQFADTEWKLIQGCAPDEDAMESCFQRLWSLKEAFVKARGDGLGFEPLSRAEFQLSGEAGRCGHRGGCVTRAATATVRVDGAAMPCWSFELAALGADHVVSVARGPPSDIVDAYGGFTATLGRASLREDDIRAHVAAAPGPSFRMLTVEQLLAVLDGTGDLGSNGSSAGEGARQPLEGSDASADCGTNGCGPTPSGAGCSTEARPGEDAHAGVEDEGVAVAGYWEGGGHF